MNSSSRPSRPSILGLIFVFLAGIVVRSPAADAGATITVAGEIYQTKRTTVSALLKAVPVEPKKPYLSPFVPVDAKQLYDTLQKKAQGFNSGTTLTKLPEIKVASGGRQIGQAKDLTIEADATLGADGETITTNAIVKIGPKMVLGTITAKNGESAFLGTADGTTPDTLRIVFIRFVVAK
jgi:hypothetical protein